MTRNVFEVHMKKASLAVCGGARYGWAMAGHDWEEMHDADSDSRLFDRIGVIFLSTIRRLADKVRLGEKKNHYCYAFHPPGVYR